MTTINTRRGKIARQARKYPKPFKIVYEDAHLIVADKSAGILTVPIPGKMSRNLKDLLDEYLVSKKTRVLTVHRIDRYTSGLVVFAKNERARDNLIAQFKAHSPERVYLAVVRGELPETGSLRHNLMLGKAGFRQFAVRSGGTSAVTHYKVIERIKGLSVLEVRLETGLKNQIRVQFMEAGHPLLGDRHYTPAEGEEKLLDRQALHSWKLSFTHPADNRKVSFETPPPPDIVTMLGKLRHAEKFSANTDPAPPKEPSKAKAGKPKHSSRARRLSSP